MDVTKTSCPLIQTYQTLLDEIPSELLKLSYGVYPNDETYNNKRFIYNKLFNYFPHAIFYPSTDNQISYLIQNFTKYNLDFSIRCGGHAYEPASLSEGYIISMENFSKITICDKKMTVSVGSGVKLGTLISTLAKKRYIAPTGTSSCVGVSGLSLAGGKGYLSRLYGMVCDNIVSVTLINGEGNVVKANADTNPDLFWAIKGSGTCNYGVITQIEIKIYKDIYFQLTTLTWSWNPITIKKVLDLYQKYIIKFPNNISADINMTYNDTSASFAVKFYKFGKEEFIEIDEFINLLQPDIKYCKGYYSQITDCWVDYPNGKSPCFSKMKSIMVFKPISFNGIDLMINSINNLLTSQTNIFFQINLSQLGGEVNNGNSAYFPKNAIYVITILNQWNSQKINEYSINYVSDLYKKLIPYTSKYCFPNMIDYELINYMDAYYGTNAAKLIDIKSKYDPENIFNWKQSIPLKK